MRMAVAYNVRQREIDARSDKINPELRTETGRAYAYKDAFAPLAFLPASAGEITATTTDISDHQSAN